MVATFVLGDIARIERGYQDPPAPKVRHDGREVIALGISMARGGDIIKLGENLAIASKRLRKDLPAGYRVGASAGSA
jgi:multidrug efflux pump